MDKSEVLKQSRKAYDQWCGLWRHNSNIVRNLNKIPMDQIRGQGTGKQLVIVSMGGSFEKQIEVLKKHQDKVDILAVDKAFVSLMANGIKPDYVLIADAQVSFQCYCEPLLEETSDVMLISNVNANPDWGANWRGPKTYYVNKDNIESEKEFSRISGVYDTIPAGSNVSNAAVIYSNEVLKYDNYILLGFDFSWGVGDKFYSFASGTEKMGNKSVALNNMRVLNRNYDLVNCSENLWFSARWLDMYIRSEVGQKCLNASDGILEVPKVIDLKERLLSIKKYKRELTNVESNSISTMNHRIYDDKSFNDAVEIMKSEDMLVNTGNLVYIDKNIHKLAKAPKDNKTNKYML